MSKTVIFWAAAALVAAGRFAVPGHAMSLAGSYEALAHIWVGAMLGAWLFDRKPRYLLALGALTALETVMFLMK